jgi:general secretion pathway protein L
MSTTPGTLPDRGSVPPWRQKLAAFWRWWSGEIARMVPERFGGGFAGSSRAPLVALEGDSVALLEVRGTALAETSRSPLASLDPEGRRLAMRNLLAGAGEQQMRVRLVLAREESLLRRVSLPLATEENLAQVLAFEMDRLSPFRAEDVYFGYRTAGRDVAAGKVQVDLGVARRAIIDERVARLREWGASVQGVVLADDVVRSALPVDLLPESQRGEREASGMRRIQLGLAVAVVALFAFALGFPVWQKREAVITMMPALVKAKAEAEGTDALARELERNVADYNFLLSKKHATQPVLAFIEELSRLLPDSTWVQQLDIRPQGKLREVQISGETPSSSKLIEIFEQATTMKNAAPRGSVTRGSVPGTERFLIAAEAKPRALPEPLPAAAVPGAAASPAPVTPVVAPTPAASAPAAVPPPTATVTVAPPPQPSSPPSAAARPAVPSPVPETMGGSRPPPPAPAAGSAPEVMGGSRPPPPPPKSAPVPGK